MRKSETESEPEKKNYSWSSRTSLENGTSLEIPHTSGDSSEEIICDGYSQGPNKREQQGLQS